MATPQTVINAIVAPFTAAAEIATAIDTVATALDGARTVVLIVENTTHHDLELVANSHEHGGFDVTPALIVPKLSTAVFSSKDKGFMTGTEGLVRYRVKDNLSEETLLLCTWNNPFVGSNKAGRARLLRRAADAGGPASDPDSVGVLQGDGDLWRGRREGRDALLAEAAVAQHALLPAPGRPRAGGSGACVSRFSPHTSRGLIR